MSQKKVKEAQKLNINELEDWFIRNQKKVENEKMSEFLKKMGKQKFFSDIADRLDPYH